MEETQIKINLEYHLNLTLFLCSRATLIQTYFQMVEIVLGKIKKN